MSWAIGTSIPVLGRDLELQQLRRALASATTGEGATLRLVGPAGFGKTRLMHEVLTDTTLPVLAGHVDPAERGRPFAAFTRALGLDLSDLRAPSLASTLAGDPMWVAIDAVVDEVDRRTAGGPLVLVLDDLHWADPGTWQAAAVLARRSLDIGLLLLLAHRPMVGDAQLAVPVAQIGDELRLEPLTEDATIDVAAAVLGAEPSDADRAHLRRAGGNPFFVLEVAHWRHRQTTAPIDQDPGLDELEVPELVARQVRRQLDDLPATAVTVLRTLALLGRRSSVATVAAHTSLPPDVVAAAVEHATGVGLVDDQPDGIAFRHDLVRAVVEADTPPSVAAAHLAVAAARPTVDPWAATHLAEQAQVGDHRAAAVLLRAARASGISAEAAAVLLGHVLRIGPPPEEPVGAVEVDYLSALLRAGDPAVVPEAKRLAAALPAPDPELPAVVELQRLRARLHLTRSEAAESVALLRELETVGGVTAERATADRCFVEVVATSRAEAAAEAAEHRLVCTDPLARANAELAVSIAATRAGRFGEGVDAAAAAVAQAAVDPAVSADLHPEVILANALLYAERFEEATEALRHAEASARRHGVVWPRPHHLAFRAGDALRQGQFDACLAAAREAIGWSEDSAQRITATWPHVFSALAATHIGDVAEAERSLQAVQEEMAAGRLQGAEAVPWVEALLAELAGDAAAGVAVLLPLVQLADGFGLRIRVPMIAPEAARLAWLAEDRAAVSTLVRLLDGYDDFAVEEARAAQDRCRGFATNDPGRLAAAAARYRSLGSHTQAGIAWAEAVLVAARSDPDKAVRLYQEHAEPALTAIGAHGVLARTRASVPVRVSRRLGRRKERPVSGLASLTPAERRVVDLVGAGASNGEIAEELSVSRRTVESHLSRIYRRLGVRSRVRLAALVQAERAGA